MEFATADLYDRHEREARVVLPGLRRFGARRRFAGPVSTVKVHEDNSLVRAVLEEPGAGRVLVVDGGGSLRCALMGDMLAGLGRDNGWAGAVVYGCIRDGAAINGMDFGIHALATIPRKSVKRGEGQRDIEVTFLGATFRPGDYLYADEDGILLGSAKWF